MICNIIKRLLIIVFLCAPLPAAAGEASRVFIVASYEEGHVCGGPQEEGVVAGLAEKGWTEGGNLEVRRYYMDTKRANTTPELMREQAARALERINEFKPDVVVTLDDNAFREVGLALAGREGVSVVFSGLNGQPEEYDEQTPFMHTRQAPGGNITGVYEKLYVERSVRVFEMIPDLKGDTYVFITDRSPTGYALAKQLALELENPLPGLKYRFEVADDWAGYQALILSLNESDSVKGIYPVALTLKVDDQTTYTTGDIFGWTIRNSRHPEMALNYFFSKIGLFGGAAVDFISMGRLAGLKAGAILDGEPAGTLPIEDAPDYAIVFNLTRARSLGIEIPHSLLTAADLVYE